MINEFVNYIYPLINSKLFIYTSITGLLIIGFKGYGYYSNIQTNIELTKGKEIMKSQEINMMTLEDVIGHVESVDAKCNFLMGRVRLIDDKIRNLGVANKDILKYVSDTQDVTQLNKIEQKVNILEESLLLMDDKINCLQASCGNISASIESSPVWKLCISRDNFKIYNPETGEIFVAPFTHSNRETLIELQARIQEYSARRAITNNSIVEKVTAETHSDTFMACPLEDNISCSSYLINFESLVPYVLIILTFMLVMYKIRR